MDVSALNAISQRIAPELDDRLAMFVREPDWPFPDGVLGLYSPDSPPWARSQGSKADCIIFADEAAATIETLVHELSHALPRHPDSPLKTEPWHHEQERYLVAWETGPKEPGMSFGGLPPWFGHEDKFIRRLIHLAHRAERIGLPVTIQQAFFGPYYGLRSSEAYQYALATEPARCLGRSFWEIEQTEPPEKFTRFFNEDTSRYWARNPAKGNADDPNR